VDLGVSEAGVVVDDGVDVVVAQTAPARGALSAAVEAPSAAVRDATELLHIDMDQRSGVVVLISFRGPPSRADHGPRDRVHLAQQRDVVAAKYPPDGGGLQTELACDEHWAAAGELPHDPHSRLRAYRGPVRVGVGDAGTVDQPGRTVLPESAPPAPRGRARDAHLCGHVRDRTPRLDALDHDQPAGRSQPGISVGHEKPPCVRAAELDSSNSTPESGRANV